MEADKCCDQVDLALGHVAALKRAAENCGCTAYNLGSGKGVSVKEVVAAFAKASGQAIPTKVAPRRPGDIAACYADASKAERELGGWKCTRGIDEVRNMTISPVSFLCRA